MANINRSKGFVSVPVAVIGALILAGLGTSLLKFKDSSLTLNKNDYLADINSIVNQQIVSINQDTAVKVKAAEEEMANAIASIQGQLNKARSKVQKKALQKALANARNQGAAKINAIRAEGNKRLEEVKEMVACLTLINSQQSIATTTPAIATTTPPTTTSGLKVELIPDQPAKTLAPTDVALMSFTKIKLTAVNNDVIINSFIVERIGTIDGQAVTNVKLLDDGGFQVGATKSISLRDFPGSSRSSQTTVGYKVVIRNGQSMVFTIAAEPVASTVAGGVAGQTIALSVKGVNASVPVTADFPLTGTTHTINETLTIGSVIMARGPLDPGASQTKEIGTTNYTFSSVKVTAGSAERVYLKSIRWNQTGSAGATDLTNVKTVVDGTSYDTALSADGKYYITIFSGNGLLIDKGFSKEVSIKGDIKGGSGKTVDFDLEKKTDVYLVGETYSYRIVPPQTGIMDPINDTAAFSNVEDPWYDAAQVLITAQPTATDPTLTISVSTEPKSQNVIAGSQQFEFARYILDASDSSEDLRLTSLPLEYNVSSGSATDLTSCRLYDGSIVLTSGANLVNPTARSSSMPFNFDGAGLVLTKGLAKQLSLKCDIKSAATGVYQWGYDNSADWTNVFGAFGVTSGKRAIVYENDNPGNKMTVGVAGAAGTLSVSLDFVAPYKIAAPGETVELARLKFTGTGEDIQLRQVALQLSQPELNTPLDLVGEIVTLWDGATQVGTAVFTNDTDYASSASYAFANFVVPADGSKVLTVKGTMAGISAAGPLTKSGDLLKVDYDGNNAGLNGTYGTGLSSGQTITPIGADTQSTGVRIMKSYPTFTKVNLSAIEKTLLSGDSRTLYKFKITANSSGDVVVEKFTFNVTSNPQLDISKFGLYAFMDSSFSVTAGDWTNGLLNNLDYKLSGNIVEVYTGVAGTGELFKKSFVIPAGESRWLVLRGSVGVLPPSGTSASLSVQLEGDAGVPQRAVMQTAGALDFEADNDFIWSPRSTSTTQDVHNYLSNLDWTNGYGVSGLPSSNLMAETLSK